MKKLIVNPTSLIGVKMLEQIEMLSDLTETVFKQKKESFIPITSKIDHLSRFVNLVQPRSIAIQSYVHTQINSFEEAMAFLNQVGREVYHINGVPNPLWSLKVIKMEIDAERRGNAVFGIKIPNDPVIKAAIEKELSIACDIEFNDASEQSLEKKANKKTKTNEEGNE